MATDARFDVDGTRYAEPKKRSFWQSCLIGCLVVFAILLVILILAGVWVSQHWRGWVSDFGSLAMKQMIADAELTPDQKQAISIQIDRVADGFKNGQLSLEQIADRILKSPLMDSILATAADKKYITGSRLSDQEKAEGRTSVRRFARGVIDHKITQAEAEATLDHICNRHGNNIQLKPFVTDDELRAFLKQAKEQSDKAGIPEQPETIDAAAEFKKIVDEAMNENPPAPPLDAPK
jgi:hypothetical protein